MSKVEFDHLIHAPNRLQICAFLSATDEVEFQVLKEHLEVSDSVLSKHVKALEDAGYVKTKKRTKLGRPCTWLELSHNGLQAFQGHVRALKEIVE